MINNLKIKDIVAPPLTEPNYGENINDMFKNIKHNFDVLANRDFVKGEKGDSMIVRRTELTPDIIELFKTAIQEEFQNGMDNMNGVSVYEQFNSNPGSIVLIFEVGEEGDKLISSLPYTFHDYRFTKANQDLSIYSDQTDCSCIIVYNEGKFEVLQVYPTIYYNKEKGDFCWSINGIRTNLVAQGPVGEDGKPGVPKLVTISDHVNDSGLYVIEQIMYNGEWVNTYLNSSISHREQCRMMDLDNNCPVLVMQVGTGITYLSMTYIPENNPDQLWVRCGDGQSIYEISTLTTGEVSKICDEIWG